MPVPFPEHPLRGQFHFVLHPRREGQHTGSLSHGLPNPFNERAHVRDVGRPGPVRDRVRCAVGAVVDGYQELRLDGVDASDKRVRAVLAAPFREAHLHMDEVGDPAAQLLERPVGLDEVTRVQKRDAEVPDGDEVSAVGQVRPLVFPAFDDVHVNGPEVQFERAGKDAGFSADVAQVTGEDDLHDVGIQVLRNGQVPVERGVSVFFVNRLIGIAAPGADEDFLEAIASAEPAKRARMAVVEVFVADEDVVEIGRRAGQVIAKQVGVEGEVDRAGPDLESAAAGPFEKDRIHG